MDEEQQLIELFLEHFGLDESQITREMSLDELVVDSLELLELVVAAEDLFDVKLDDEAIAACQNLGQAMDLVLAAIRSEA